MPNPVINMGNRPWPEADDNELIGCKLDARSRPSWETIGQSQRMRRSADSCKARWQWLKNTRPDLLTRADNEAADLTFVHIGKSFLLLLWLASSGFLLLLPRLLSEFVQFPVCWLLVHCPHVVLPPSIGYGSLPISSPKCPPHFCP